jgi:hypothetical protein
VTALAIPGTVEVFALRVYAVAHSDAAADREEVIGIAATGTPFWLGAHQAGAASSSGLPENSGTAANATERSVVTSPDPKPEANPHMPRAKLYAATGPARRQGLPRRRGGDGKSGQTQICCDHGSCGSAP